MNKLVIKMLQGSVVTQTVLGGLTIYPAVAYSWSCIFLPEIIRVDWQ